MATFSIWGSCVSREIFNYTDPSLKIQRYIMQNPIHTLCYKGLEINEDEIIGDVNFLKKMFKLELNKKAIEYFSEVKSDYLVIDTSDCRLGWYGIESSNDVRVAASPTCEKNYNLLSRRKEKLIKHYADEISDNEWCIYVEKFADMVLNFYSKDRIILNKFEFSRGGYDIDLNKWREYETFGNIDKQNELTDKVQKFFEEAFEHKCLVLEAYTNPEGNWKNHMGPSPLHYTDEVYETQARKLEALIN